MNLDQSLKTQIAALRISKIKYHIFLCCDQTKPKCCAYEDGIIAWDYLKQRIAELQQEGVVGLFRTKANCLRVCMKGPIAVVYPEGIWYHSCSPKILERILQEHILQGKIVEDFLLEKPE